MHLIISPEGKKISCIPNNKERSPGLALPGFPQAAQKFWLPYSSLHPVKGWVLKQEPVSCQ